MSVTPPTPPDFPLPTDSPEDFDDKAYDCFPYVALAATNAYANAQAAETAAAASAGSATNSANSATASEVSRQAADAALVDAEAAAAAAQLAAGFPTDPNFGSVFRSEGVANVKTSSFAAVVGRVYDCDTSAGAFTVTLPASLSIGDWIGLRDFSGTWSLNNLTVNRNGHNIFGVAENEILDMNQSTVFLEYRGSTPGVIY